MPRPRVLDPKVPLTLSIPYSVRLRLQQIIEARAARGYQAPTEGALVAEILYAALPSYEAAHGCSWSPAMLALLPTPKTQAQALVALQAQARASLLARTRPSHTPEPLPPAPEVPSPELPPPPLTGPTLAELGLVTGTIAPEPEMDMEAFFAKMNTPKS